jgi:hypothetical protein
MRARVAVDMCGFRLRQDMFQVTRKEETMDVFFWFSDAPQR